MTHLERQDTFGWLLSVESFLVGAGGGAFLFGFIYNLFEQYQLIAKIGMVVGVSLVIIGAVLLFIELGRKKRFYMVAFNASSWISRGSWFITIFIVFGLTYLSSGYLGYLDIESMLVKGIGVIAALSAVFVMSYTGFLFGAAKRIPLWNASGLPMLFFFSSLYTGKAIMLLIAAFLETSITEGLRPYTGSKKRRASVVLRHSRAGCVLLHRKESLCKTSQKRRIARQWPQCSLPKLIRYLNTPGILRTNISGRRR